MRISIQRKKVFQKNLEGNKRGDPLYTKENSMIYFNVHKKKCFSFIFVPITPTHTCFPRFFYRSADQGIEYLGLVAKFAQQNKLAEYLSTKHESIMKQFVSEVGAVEHEFMVIIFFFAIKKFYFWVDAHLNEEKYVFHVDTISVITFFFHCFLIPSSCLSNLFNFLIRLYFHRFLSLKNIFSIYINIEKQE